MVAGSGKPEGVVLLIHVYDRCSLLAPENAIPGRLRWMAAYVPAVTVG
jgi:hypothetical protein